MAEAGIKTTVADIIEETKRLVDSAEKRRIIIRLFGGMAVRFHCPSATHRSLERKYADVDFMALKKQSGKIKEFFLEMGYAPRSLFNAVYGDQRLIFNDIERGRRVDIFLDIFEMCHRFDFRNRLTLDKPTIPLADMLATKLQVVEITEREYRDIIAILYDHEVADRDAPEIINGSYLAKLCANDWGIYKTFQVNLRNITSALGQYKLDTETEKTVRKRVEDLTSKIESEPKTLGWKLRAKIGEKRQWYELPETDKKVVDSRLFGENEKTQ